MANVKVGINGFGRIGRNLFRAAHESGAELEIVAVNDVFDAASLGHLLKYDSTYGRFDAEVETGETRSRSTATEVKVLSERDPADLPWGELGVDVVIESTGLFTKRDGAAKHLEAGREEGDHLRAGDRSRRDRRARGQLRRRLRPRRATTSSRTPPARPTASRRSRRCSTTRSGSSAA